MNARKFSRAVVGLALAVGLFAQARESRAYVRSYTLEGCHPVFWNLRCVHLTADSDGVRDMPLADVENTIRTSINSWMTLTKASSFLELTYLPANGRRETVATDKLQVIKFRSTTWGRPATDKNPAVTYDPAAAAITTVTYINKPTDATADGRIVDADIELNAVNNYFYNVDQAANPVTGSRKATDLWNTLTHEIGHLMGLEHTCKRTGDSMPACTRDGAGSTVISCGVVEAGRQTNQAYQAIYDTTMYPTADPKEVKKRQPKADDVSGIVNTYPSAMNPNTCTVPDAYSAGQATGCSMNSPGIPTTGAQPGALAAVGALSTLALLALLRRRRQRIG